MILIFLFKQKNVKEMMDCNGVRILVDLLTLAHLHTSRATVPLQVCVIHAFIHHGCIKLIRSDGKDMFMIKLLNVNAALLSFLFICES